MLLREALRTSGRVAIGRITLKTKQHIGVIRVLGHALVLQLLHWPSELVALDDFTFPVAEVNAAELTLARQLMDGRTGDFDPSSLVNEHRLNVMRIITAREAGEEIPFDAQADPAKTREIDLLAILQASVAQAGARAA